MVSTPFKTYNYPCKIPTLCPCGGNMNNKSQHKKTNKHQKYEYNISRGIITINK